MLHLPGQDHQFGDYSELSTYLDSALGGDDRAVGHTYDLYNFLVHPEINKATPGAIAPYIDAVRNASDSRPVSLSILEQAFLEDGQRFLIYEEVRAQNPFDEANPERYDVLGAYADAWKNLTQSLHEKLGGTVGDSTVYSSGQLDPFFPDSETWFHGYDMPFNRREHFIHTGQALDDMDFLADTNSLNRLREQVADQSTD